MLLSWIQNLMMCLDVAGATNDLHSFHPQIIHETSVLGPLVPVVKVSDFGMARMKYADEEGAHRRSSTRP